MKPLQNDMILYQENSLQLWEFLSNLDLGLRTKYEEFSYDQELGHTTIPTLQYWKRNLAIFIINICRTLQWLLLQIWKKKKTYINFF